MQSGIYLLCLRPCFFVLFLMRFFLLLNMKVYLSQVLTDHYHLLHWNVLSSLWEVTEKK